MFKIILKDPRYLRPFNERARDLRILNKPLWLLQRDILAPYTSREIELADGSPLPDTREACLVYRDNLFFDEEFIETFIGLATARPEPSRAAFSIKDPAFREHALPLSTSYSQEGDLYLADLWYYPNGPTPGVRPLLIDLQLTEAGYYHVPTYMAYEQGDLVFQVPLRSLLAIDSWVHIFIADVVFGIFTRGARYEARLKNDPFFKLGILGKAMVEGKQVLESSKLVKIGHNCVIDPSAVIHGPTSIGNNVTIGAGTVIENCVIGNNVNISQGCQLMLSVVGDGAFLPFRASLFMTSVMDNSMIAQNTCLQMSVVGRNTFIGAGTTFTDFNLLPAPLRAINGSGNLQGANRPVLGGCVGHNCRIGAGMIIFPARTIESDVVVFASHERRVIDRDLFFEDSDHHLLRFKDLHPRYYPRPGELEMVSW
jgi:UDP-N-acetylglucosamine diphosphorylase / glucose-1-phosphate thymidylyltransferase / UDP-N-acetylgalactosamine diphosphorylase / glucosamine-1-phosphate N-acetyltransferase / galactosamine-1-phosphate N-acetyltransferase